MISLLWERTEALERVLEKSAHLAEVDPHGFVTVCVGISVVFMSLVLLCLTYSFAGWLFTSKLGKISFKQLRKGRLRSRSAERQDVMSEDEAAAIATAINLYLEQQTPHDHESGVITIKK